MHLKKASNKKVLLHERKRHTAHHVASARSAALPPDEGEDTPSSPDGGGGTHPILMGGTPILTWDLTWMEGTPLSGRMRCPHWDGWGCQPSGRMGVPPKWWTK